jgi:hypothetical protein
MVRPGLIGVLLTLVGDAVPRTGVNTRRAASAHRQTVLATWVPARLVAKLLLCNVLVKECTTRCMREATAFESDAGDSGLNRCSAQTTG